MPDSFGSSSLANYDYSIYASYTPGASQECGVPSGLNATDIEETSATFNWGTVSTAQSYDIRYKETSDSSWIPTTSSTNSTTISGLTAETEYEFQVRAVCSDGTSDYSSSANFTTSAAPQECGVPSRLDATDIEETSATLNWGTVTSAQSYDIRYKATSDSNWISTTSSTNSTAISGLTAETEYEFQVRAVCSDGASDYSSSANFTTSAATQECRVPSGLDATDIEQTSATLNWGTVSTAQSYDIRYKETSDSSWISTTSSTNSTAISGLTAETEYEFQVRAVCSDGTSDYSSSANFTTSAATQECGVPSRLDATNITEDSATLTWSEVSSATDYRIQYREVGAGTWTTITSSSPSAGISGLAAGTQYEFQVQSICSSGDSDYSDAITFTTLSDGETATVGNTDIFSTTTNAANRRAVSYTMPEDGTIQSITMYHRAGSGDMILAVYEGESEPTNLLGKSETVAVADSDDWQTVNLVTPVFVAEGTTIWLAWVLEENSGILVYESGSIPRADAGVGWSAGMPDSFGSSSLANYSYSIYATYQPGGTQDCAVPSGLEATDITQTSAVLRWNGVSSATGYRVQYRQPGEDWTTTTSSGVSMDLTDLTSDTLYEFQVQAICSVGDSQYSSIAEFTTAGEQTSETVGHTTIFDTTTNVSNRRAVQYTMPSSGTIESITMYHLAGSGDMILAVYEGDDSPTNLLAKTDTVQVDDRDGWQTVNLQTPVHVDSGETIWLAWVLEENSGIIVYRSGSVPRAHAVWGSWSAGMPDSFGNSRLANYEYSIYATYIPDADPEPDPEPEPDPDPDPEPYPENSMGYVGASMAENVADGYRTVGGRRMWGGYGTGGMVIQNWANPDSESWDLFDEQVAKYGKPTAVWVQIIIFASQGATYDEVKQMIANTRQHAAEDAHIYISGQPLYPEGNVCPIAGADGPQLTDDLAQQAGDDASLNVEYVGTFTLKNSETDDGCHANSAGEIALGNQAVEKFGE
jgi:hypothetical protein